MDEKTKAELESIERDIKMYQDNISAGVSEDLKKIIIEGIEKSQQKLKDINTELESKELDVDEIDRNSVRIVKSDVNKLLEETEEILSEFYIQSEEVEKEVEILEPATPEDFLVPEIPERFEETVEREIIDLEDNTPLGEQEENENNPAESIAESEDSEHWQEIPTLEEDETSVVLEEADEPEKSEDIEGENLEAETEEDQSTQTTIIDDIGIQIPEDQNSEFQEKTDNSEGIVVQIKEPSEEHKKEAESVIENRKKMSDTAAMLRYLAMKGVILEGCKEAFQKLKKASREQSEGLIQENIDYDKGERTR